MKRFLLPATVVALAAVAGRDAGLIDSASTYITNIASRSKLRSTPEYFRTTTVNGEGKRVWTSRRNMRCPSARFRWPFCLERTQTSPRSGPMLQARIALAKPQSRVGLSGLALAKGLSIHFDPCGPPKYRRRPLHRSDPSKSNSRRRCPDRRPRLRPRFRRRPCCHCPRSRSSFPARSSAERPLQTRHSRTE